MGWEFPWYYQHTLTHGNDDVQAHGFNHWLTSEGDPDFAQLVDTMQSTIKAKECLRVRADMTLYNSEGYRHAFHAGNHADVLKHIVWIEILSYLSKKDKAFYVHDTHAGAGTLVSYAPSHC